MQRDAENNIVIYNKFTKETKKFELMNVLEFTSARKRMSVIVRAPDGRILLLTKGADSVIVPLLTSGQDDLIKMTLNCLTKFANTGLRTLLVAEREIDPYEYEGWNKKYQKATCAIKDR